ncbi:MAG: tripartite tricarboxylate transporter substrate binding protein [Candidatus Neomarinimicrobiota bacterium]
MRSKRNLKRLSFSISVSWKALTVVVTATVITAALICVPAYAAFPDKPLTVVVPYKAGGSTDTMIRVLAKALAKEVGQPVVVQNRPGAGGAVGGMYIKNRPPDGYAFLVGSVSIPTWSPIHDKVDFTVEDFTYLGSITEYQQAMITTPDKPFKTLEELIAYSRKNPGLTFADQSSISKHVILYVAKQEGLDWRAVPTKGGGGMVPMLLGGHLDFAWSGGVHQRYGDKMIVLASCNPGRLAASPDVPALSEKYSISIPSLVVVMGPKGIPADRVKFLENALRNASSNDPAFVKLLKENLKFPLKFRTGAEVEAQLPNLIKQLKAAKETMGF